MFNDRRFCAACLLSCLCLLMSGCAVDSSDTARLFRAAPLAGKVYGGHTPVSGATVQLYAVSPTAGAPSTPLLAEPLQTDATGAFTVRSTYFCPSASSLVYLVATEGNPGLAPGSNNSSLSLMSAIGPCSTLSLSTPVTINEVSTVVAVWALAPFMTSYARVGSSAANAGELPEAFQRIRATVDLSGNLQSSAASAGSDESTSQINTVANVLSACVITKGGAAGDGSPCGALFREVTTRGGKAPAETVGAALAMANNPTLNTPALHSLSTSTTPYQPALTAPPASWSVLPLASGSTTMPAGDIADYNFYQRSGTVLVDQTKDGNNGTLGTGALAPAWTSTGLHFAAQQNVSLPASLNQAQTFFYAVYIDPLARPPLPTNQYPVLMSSSEGYSGFNFLYEAFLGAELVPYAYAPTIYAAGRPTTAARGALSGFHVLGVVLGVSGSAGSLASDHLYVDGQEVSSYVTEGSSAGSQQGGNFFLGSSNVSPLQQSGFNGTMYRMVVYPNQVSAAAVKTASSAMATEVAQRGVATGPVAQPPAVSRTLYAIGDSITAGLGVSDPWPSLLAFPNSTTYKVNNLGISGLTMEAISGSEPNRVATGCKTASGPAVAIVFAGTNDLFYGEISPAMAMMFLANEISALKQGGCSVLVGTMISRGGSDTQGVSLDQKKDAYNSLILADAVADGAEGLVDFAANPLLGADGAYSDTNFQGDGLHPDAAGQRLLGAAASNTLAYYLQTSSTTTSNPKYPMSSADRYLTVKIPSSGVVTLPDCTGPTGANYAIRNSGSAFTLRSGQTSQPITGYASGIPLKPGQLVHVVDTANAPAVSGCHWDVAP